MSLVLLYLVPALIGLIAVWLARGQKNLAARIGLAALLAMPAVTAWHGLVLASKGVPAAAPAIWATIWSVPGWGVAIFLGSLIIRKPT